MSGKHLLAVQVADGAAPCARHPPHNAGDLGVMHVGAEQNLVEGACHHSHFSMPTASARARHPPGSPVRSTNTFGRMARQFGGIVIPVNAQMRNDDLQFREGARDGFETHGVHVPREMRSSGASPCVVTTPVWNSTGMPSASALARADGRPVRRTHPRQGHLDHSEPVLARPVNLVGRIGARRTNTAPTSRSGCWRNAARTAASSAHPNSGPSPLMQHLSMRRHPWRAGALRGTRLRQADAHGVD